MDIKIDYNGVWPALCKGHLKVTIGKKKWDFGSGCLTSGGSIRFFNGYRQAKIETGAWTVSDWPEDFPENLKSAVLEAVNNEIPWGCCGGCI